MRRVDALEIDEQVGVITCQWYSREPRLPYRSIRPSWIFLGEGMGQPVFSFVPVELGHRLFRISFEASNSYYAAILRALTQNYGAPKSVAKPFQTRGGATFPNLVSLWSNGVSEIVLEQRCSAVDTYCLTYRHEPLGRIYDGLILKRSAEKAGRI